MPEIKRIGAKAPYDEVPINALERRRALQDARAAGRGGQAIGIVPPFRVLLQHGRNILGRATGSATTSDTSGAP